MLKAGQRPAAEQLAEAGRLLGEIVQEIDNLALPTEPVAAPRLNPDEFQAKLKQLGSLLKSDLGAAEKLLDALRSKVAGGELEGAMEEIAAVVDIFAIDDALALISALSARMERRHERA